MSGLPPGLTGCLYVFAPRLPKSLTQFKNWSLRFLSVGVRRALRCDTSPGLAARDGVPSRAWLVLPSAGRPTGLAGAIRMNPVGPLSLS